LNAVKSGISVEAARSFPISLRSIRATNFALLLQGRRANRVTPLSIDHSRDSSRAEFLRCFNVLCAFKDSMAAWMRGAGKIDA
jgi:hypothetical protein